MSRKKKTKKRFCGSFVFLANWGLPEGCDAFSPTEAFCGVARFGEGGSRLYEDVFMSLIFVWSDKECIRRALMRVNKSGERWCRIGEGKGKRRMWAPLLFRQFSIFARGRYHLVNENTWPSTLPKRTTTCHSTLHCYRFVNAPHIRDENERHRSPIPNRDENSSH